MRSVAARKQKLAGVLGWRLQESSEETGTEEAGGDLDVGSSAGARGSRAARLLRVRASAGGAARRTARTVGTSGLSAGGGGSTVDNGGGVVGANDDLGGAVVTQGNDNGVDARGLRGDADVGREGGCDKRNGGISRGLGRNRSVYSGLGGLGGLRGGLAGHDAPAVSLLEVAGLGESIDGGLVAVSMWSRQLDSGRDLQREPRW